MGRVKISPFEAGTKLLARDRYSSIKHKSFLFDFMEYMSEDGLNLDTKEAQKIYEYFDGAIQRTLENGELELFERDEPDDGTDDKPQGDPGMTNPDYTPGKPLSHNDLETDPLTEVLTKSIGPYKGYVSGSNMGCLEEGEVITPINPFADKSEPPNGARHFEKWSEEVRVETSKQVDVIAKFMGWFGLNKTEAENVFIHLLDHEGDAGRRPPLSDKAREVLHRIKNIADIVINL